MRITWNRAKAVANRRKHGVSFEEAASSIMSALAVTALDLTHSNGEYRYLTLGLSSAGRLIAVAHTDDGDIVRIVSARRATRRERRIYEEGQAD